MLSGMKRLRWDVWLEVSGVPADHYGVVRVFWSKESTLSVLRMGGWIGRGELEAEGQGSTVIPVRISWALSVSCPSTRRC